MFLRESRQTELRISTKLTLPLPSKLTPPRQSGFVVMRGRVNLTLQPIGLVLTCTLKERHFHSMKISRFCAFEYVIREIKMSPKILASAQLQN